MLSCKGVAGDEGPQSLSPKEGMRKPTQSHSPVRPTGGAPNCCAPQRARPRSPRMRRNRTRSRRAHSPSHPHLKDHSRALIIIIIRRRRPLAASVANSSSTAAAQRQNIRQKRCHVVRLPARGVQSTTGDGSHAREHMYMSIFSVERATLEAQLKAASQARGPRPLHRVLPHLHRLPADSTPHPRPLHHHPRHPSRPP